MDRSVLWRAAALQAASVAALSIILALLLSHDFFEDWGFLAGPAAWIVCSGFTGSVLRLPLAATLIGAVLAGLPSVVAVVIGVHWLGAALAVGIFAAWCARLAVRGDGIVADAA